LITFTNNDDGNDDEFDALEITIKLGEGLSIDAYLLSDGTARYGLSKISLLLGYESKHYSQVIRRSSKKLEALRRLHFAGNQVTVRKRLPNGGFTKPKTLSFNDFCIILEYEASQSNPRAIALLTASFRELLRSRTLDALGLPQDDLKTKQAAFDLAVQQYEDVLTENREDEEGLALAGDEDRNIAEYDPAFARFENDTLYAKYSSYYPEYFDEAA